MFIGRLGNQLFQYFFLLYLQKKHKNFYIFFANPRHGLAIAKYFDLGSNNNFTLGSRLYSLFIRLIQKLIKFENVSVPSFTSPKPLKVKNNTIYWGYYQTDWYVKELGNLNISIKPKYVTEFRKKYGELFNRQKTLSVHIRRTDYLNYHKRDISLPIEYFKFRLSAIENIEQYTVFFLSDDIQFVKEAFEPKSNFIFSDNNEIVDFQIIMNSDISIISNSSFSWWAAYLSKKQNVVYAPKNWVGFRIGTSFPRAIMTDRFIWCDVLN